MTLGKACSDTEIFLAASGMESGTSSTRGKCLTTELPRFPPSLQCMHRIEEKMLENGTCKDKEALSKVAYNETDNISSQLSYSAT